MTHFLAEFLEDEIRVKKGLKRLKESFASLKDKVAESLESKEDLDFETVRLYVLNTFMSDDLASAPNLTEMFEILSKNRMWDYYNYTALVEIAEVFGGDDPELMELVNGYRLEMERFQARTRIEHYIEARGEDRSQEEGITVLPYRDILKVDLKFEFIEKSLVYLDTIERSLFGYFKCPRQSGLLHTIEVELYQVWDYVVEIIWLVPPATAEVIKEQFEENDSLVAEVAELEEVKDMVRQQFS